MGTQDASSLNSGIVSLSADLGSLLDDRETADVVFVVGSEMSHIHAHRLVLSVRCDYYRQRKYDLWIKPYSPMAPLSVKRPQSTPAVFKNVLQFLYTGKVLQCTRGTWGTSWLSSQLQSWSCSGYPQVQSAFYAFRTYLSAIDILVHFTTTVL